mmetsp:Transcript_155765/g.499291  ORF Transcript_155765/g.499291 Transcript_155765/m.499291 type:complete len:434 (-) Transcript_155765:414-1715(-)
MLQARCQQQHLAVNLLVGEPLILSGAAIRVRGSRAQTASKAMPRHRTCEGVVGVVGLHRRRPGPLLLPPLLVRGRAGTASLEERADIHSNTQHDDGEEADAKALHRVTPTSQCCQKQHRDEPGEGERTQTLPGCNFVALGDNAFHIGARILPRESTFDPEVAPDAPVVGEVGETLVPSNFELLDLRMHMLHQRGHCRAEEDVIEALLVLVLHGVAGRLGKVLARRSRARVSSQPNFVRSAGREKEQIHHLVVGVQDPQHRPVVRRLRTRRPQRVAEGPPGVVELRNCVHVEVARKHAGLAARVLADERPQADQLLATHHLGVAVRCVRSLQVAVEHVKKLSWREADARPNRTLRGPGIPPGARGELQGAAGGHGQPGEDQQPGVCPLPPGRPRHQRMTARGHGRVAESRHAFDELALRAENGKERRGEQLLDG